MEKKSVRILTVALLCLFLTSCRSQTSVQVEIETTAGQTTESMESIAVQTEPTETVSIQTELQQTTAPAVISATEPTLPSAEPVPPATEGVTSGNGGSTQSPETQPPVTEAPQDFSDITLGENEAPIV